LYLQSIRRGKEGKQRKMKEEEERKKEESKG
jgi:hypothetical protein